jgi:hypothetical protein
LWSGPIGDLHAFDLSNKTWIHHLLSWLKPWEFPSPREQHGLTSAEGKLYLFGGVSFGELRVKSPGMERVGGYVQGKKQFRQQQTLSI